MTLNDFPNKKTTPKGAKIQRARLSFMCLCLLSWQPSCQPTLTPGGGIFLITDGYFCQSFCLDSSQMPYFDLTHHSGMSLHHKIQFSLFSRTRLSVYYIMASRLRLRKTWQLVKDISHETPDAKTALKGKWNQTGNKAA